MSTDKKIRGKTIYIKLLLACFTAFSVFTIISIKIDYLLTPEVICTKVTSGALEYRYSGIAEVIDGRLCAYIPNTQIEFWSEEISLEVERETVQMYTKISTIAENNGLHQIIFSPMNGELSSKSDEKFLEVQYKKALGTFPQTVPAECVYSDDGQSYLLVAEDTTSQFNPVIARKILVHVQSEDGYLAAIEGAIPKQGRVIQYANNQKLLVPGEKVRLA